MLKIAVVSGVSYGLGEAICLSLLKLGFRVYGISRTTPKINDSFFVWLEADLLDDCQLKDITNHIKEKKIDLLINNAGTAFLKKTKDYTDSDFEKMFNLNFKIHVKLTNLLLDRLEGGVIINISSLSDRYPDPEWGLYGASKTALNLFFETMAAENKDVKIINILPSYVDTPLQHELHDGTDFDWNLCMQPSDIADAIVQVWENLSGMNSGSRVVVEKEAGENKPYNPEKLWVFAASDKTLRHVR